MFNNDFTYEKPQRLSFECPLIPLMANYKKDKKCCKRHKKGDRCRKCPGRK